jgi:hypothetical protein
VTDQTDTDDELMVGLSHEGLVILEIPGGDVLALDTAAARQLARALLDVANDADVQRAAGN